MYIRLLEWCMADNTQCVFPAIALIVLKKRHDMVCSGGHGRVPGGQEAAPPHPDDEHPLRR